MVDTLETPQPAVRRAKLRPPRPSASLVPRPRLTSRLAQSLAVPLTLLSAPAGFGKTTLLAEWAEDNPRPIAWLTLDANDRQLNRFAAHVVAAIESLAPGIGDPVVELLRRQSPVAAAEVGEALADAMLDLPHDIVLIVDDYQLGASTDVERFLGGVLRIPAPSFHLVLASRGDPALPLARMRLQGQVNEVRAADLRFSDGEAAALLQAAGHDGADPAVTAEMQRQTGGWIAGLRLATLALPAVADRARVDESIATARPLMDFLVEEVLAAQSPATQDFLLRTALVDRVSPSLADALLAQPPPEGSRALLERLVHESLFVERVDDEGEWFSYHPLFRTLVRHQLEIRLSPQQIAALHARAGDWFSARGALDEAIPHRLAARDPEGAAALVERHTPAALGREDWNAVAGWLSLLPEPIVHRRPGLLLAKGWVSHFSGRSVPLRALMAELDDLLAGPDVEPDARAAFAAERDALSVAALFISGRDRNTVVDFARGAAERVSPNHRLAAGIANIGLACALHGEGRTDEALRFLTAVVEREEDRVDAGSTRALIGLMLVHRQAGNMPACEEVTRHLVTLSERHDLPVAAGWGRWMLGGLAYQRDDLDAAFAHFSAVVADAQRVHLHCAFEAMCGLALVHQARQEAAEAAWMLRRLLEMSLDANALEYLPLLRGFEARLALLRGERERAVAWLAMEDGVAIESNALDAFDHPYLTRVKVLLAEGSAESLARARTAIDSFLAFTEDRCHGVHQVEALALSGLVLDAQGQTDEALPAMQRSVDLATPAGSIRIFLDLGPAAVGLLRRLSARHPAMPFLRRILEAPAADRLTARQTPPTPGPAVLDMLTPREADVLAGLVRRLSYQEIGAELFISMETVKSHAARIYGKLGVSGRREALAKVESADWAPPG